MRIIDYKVFDDDAGIYVLNIEVTVDDLNKSQFYYRHTIEVFEQADTSYFYNNRPPFMEKVPGYTEEVADEDQRRVSVLAGSRYYFILSSPRDPDGHNV